MTVQRSMTSSHMRHWAAACMAIMAVFALALPAQAQVTTLLDEDFEGLSLQPAAPAEDGGESIPDTILGWTHTPPADWTVDNSQMPTDGGELIGRPEWIGWSFATLPFWTGADGQRRGDFSLAEGTFAIADGDEWDDYQDPADIGDFDSTLISPTVPVTPNDYILINFDSHYRQESPQTATFTVEFDGTPQELLSYSSPDTPDDETVWNQHQIFELQVPAGVSNMVLKWNYVAGNNWYWAIDNVVVRSSAADNFTDRDNDGLTDDEETGTYSTDPNHPDSDGDGLKDGDEVDTHGTDPADADSDDDGLNDGDELNAHNTSPTDDDSDDDGLNDGDEVNTWQTDPLDPDTDGDGVSDGDEVDQERNPTLNEDNWVALLDENFDGVPLQPAVEESISPAILGWSHEPPLNWSIDNSNMANPFGVGVDEWWGWTITTMNFWMSADQQSRDSFTRSSGKFAVCDPDEWDDADSAAADNGMNSTIISPQVPVSGGQLLWIVFDSDFYPEDEQTGTFYIQWDDGADVQLLQYGPDADNSGSRNARIEFFQTAPDGVSTLTLKWNLIGANDWWWAIDNVKVLTEKAVLPEGGNDADGDGLENGVETNTGVYVDENDTGTNPNVADSDGDGVSDGREIEMGTDPNNAEDVMPIALLPVGLGIALAGAFALRRTRKTALVALMAAGLTFGGVASAATFFEDDFEGYTTTQEVRDAGYQTLETNDPASDAPWLLNTENPSDRANPPRWRGLPSTGNFMISDGDAGGGDDVMDSGQSHDLVTPAVNCSSSATVWLHADVSAVLNDNGTAVFIVEVSGDNGGSWTEFLVRVAPDRKPTGGTGDATTYNVTHDNADGYFGHLQLDISSVAGNQSQVKAKFRHYEQDFDWWIAVDNVKFTDWGVTTGTTTVFEEDFSSPASHAMVLSGPNAGDPTKTWNTLDINERWFPGVIGETDAGIPAVNRINHGAGGGQVGANFKFIMFDEALASEGSDEYMSTPVLNLSSYDEVIVEWDDEFMLEGQRAAEVLVSLDGGNTYHARKVFNYLSNALWDAGEDPSYAERAIVVPEAAGESQVVFSWRCKSDGNTGYWAVDNIKVSGNANITITGDRDWDGLPDGDEPGEGTNPDNYDSDGDGLSDGDEVNFFGTDADSQDSDNDGLTDGFEAFTPGFSPTDDSDASADWDDDGLSNLEEINAGYDYNNDDMDGDGLLDGEEVNDYETDPQDNDTDDDTMPDGFEVQNGLDPNSAVGDDGLEGDIDGDGLSNGNELERATDVGDADTDNDGLSDGDEVNNEGTNPLLWDSDKDGSSDADEINAGTDPWDDQDVGPQTPIGGTEQPLPLNAMVLGLALGVVALAAARRK